MVSVQAGAGGQGWKELPDWDTVACVCTVKHRSVLTTADWQVRFPLPLCRLEAPVEALTRPHSLNPPSCGGCLIGWSPACWLY